MTVVLALRCADGLVLAADSQITEPDRGLSYPAQKLHALGKHAAWAGSGSRAVLHDLEQMFEAQPETIVEASDVGRALQTRVVPVLEHHYENFIEKVPGQDASGSTPATYLLAAGYSDGRPFIVDVDPHGLIGHYEDIGFQAIGSGAPMAQQARALLSNFRMNERPVAYGVIAALRVLYALDETSPTVGGPMDVCRITPEGAEHLTPDDIEKACAEVRRWRELERETLDRLFD
ncbi:proteasome protein [Mycobacterium sp. smrl_JER01]|uniref:proteasome protein n=1 Tax=Mycobacterium sp. smrl_JER01 TaxID=3402633 RepID=UPI003AD5F928